MATSSSFSEHNVLHFWDNVGLLKHYITYSFNGSNQTGIFQIFVCTI